MKLLKWILIAFGGVVVLFAGVLVFIAATFDPNQYKGQIAELVKAKTHRTLTIEGNIKLSLFPTLGVQLGKTRLSEFRSDQEFAALEQMRVSLALLPLLSKDVVVDQVQLNGLHVNLVKHRDGKTNFADLLGTEEAAPAAPAPVPAAPSAAPIKFDIDGVKVSKAAVSWKDEAAGTEYTVSDLDMETGRLAPGVPVKFELSAAFSASEPKMDVKLRCGGNLTADPQRQNFSVATLTASIDAKGPQLEALLNIKLSGVDGSAKALKVGELLITVDAKQGDNAVKGTLSTPVAADLDAQLVELPSLAGEFDVASPALPMKKLTVPLAGTVRADLKKQALNADLTTRFDESNIKAKVDLSDFTAPFTRFDIAIDKLNVDRYLPAAEKKAASAEPAPQAEQPIDFSPIKSLNLAGSLGIDELVASNVKVQNLRMDVKANGGRLEVNPLSANLYEGKIRGMASVNANNNQLAIKQNLSGVSIGPLLRDAFKQDLLEGRGDVALDVTAGGNTVSAIKKALNGSAALNLKDGAIKGINLAQSLRNAKAMLTGGTRESEQAAAAGEKTDFSDLSASFVIRDGVAHNDDLVAKSPFLRLTGAGDIDIVQGSLNYLAKAAVVATSSGQGGEDLGDLKGLTVPVRISGPFAALKYKLEFGSAFSDSAKQQFQQKKEELKDKLEDQLRARLPGARKPAGETAPATGEEPAPSQTPEDKLKEKLKKLF